MLKTYKYKGGDRGYLWRYFYDPAARKLVNYLPRGLAPNLLTVFGFFFSLLPFILLFSISGTHMYSEPGNPIPRWFYVVEAFSYFFYRMLDEMDGKQARRTGNSSPLGLLFDHGLDAFTMGFQAMVMAKCLQVGDNMKGVVAVMAPCASFHFSTLEEYYTGGLFLGPCNGVTDGSIGVYFVFLLMAVAGNDFWRWPVANSGTPNEILLVDLVVYLNVIIQIVVIIMCLKNIFDHQRKQLAEGEVTGEPLNNKDLVVSIVGYFIPMVALTLLAIMGKEPLIDYPPVEGFSPLFYLILLQCLLMAHLTISLQVAHITKTHYSPFKSRLMLLQLAAVFFIYLLHLIGLNTFTKQFYTDSILVLFSLQLLFQTHFVLKVFKEVACALEIRVFCVKQHYPEPSSGGQHNTINTSKMESTISGKNDEETSSPGRKIAAHRLNQDT